MNEASRLIIQRQDGVTRIELLDRNILDEGSIQQIGEEIDGIIDEATTPRILINFKNVEYMSSAVLGMLITVNTKVRQKGGQLRLCEILPQVYEVFTITKLDKVFKIFDNDDKAMRSFT